MSRTLRYILTILLIGATAWWIMIVYRSCERDKAADNTEITNDNTGVGDTGTDDTDLEDLYEDDEEDDTTGEQNQGGDDGTSTNTNDSETSDAANNNTEDTDAGDSSDSSNEFANGGADIDGEYLVVAGAFISKRNAELFQKKLSRQGYDSERRVFIGSDYHSVIIGNFDTESAARVVSRKIGGEAYVHKKRYPKKRR